MNLHLGLTPGFEPADPAVDEGEALVVALGAYEGPLHVLLALARVQKVDLRQISVARLAEQYLAFVRAARSLRLALAAEYLVMAAWLAFLKSRLLLPLVERGPRSEAPPEDLAARLAFRLARLDAMRRAAESLEMRPILGRDVFGRGDPQAVTVVSSRRPDGDLVGLMETYATVRLADRDRDYRPRPLEAYRLDDARDRLRSLLPSFGDWTPISAAAPDPEAQGVTAQSALASTLSAALELVKEGEAEVRQVEHFEPLYLRACR